MDAMVLVVLAVVAVFVLIVLVQRWYRQRLRDALARLLTRQPELAPTSTPVGLAPAQLADGVAGCPRGDRRFGLDWGVEGPLIARLGGTDTTLTCAAFEWWWEERSEQRDANGNTTTTYATKRTPVAVTRLPVAVPDQIHIGPESVFGRLGLSRGDHQLESDAFNRRFRVLAQDRMLTVQLLDAGLQELLLSRYQGRTIELLGDLVILSGEPEERDDTLVGAVAKLPAVRADTARLLQGVPAQFWRAVARPA